MPEATSAKIEKIFATEGHFLVPGAKICDAADIGAEAHLPDGVHQSGALQSEIRKEIIRLLSERGFPGFSSRLENFEAHLPRC